jgi:hypothetical protein
MLLSADGFVFVLQQQHVLFEANSIRTADANKRITDLIVRSQTVAPCASHRQETAITSLEMDVSPASFRIRSCEFFGRRKVWVRVRVRVSASF